MTRSSLKQVFRFFLKFLLIISVIIVCDKGIGTILKYYYFRQESGVDFRTTYAMDSTHADILIFGSSRASHHYIPDIFEDRLHYTCYNTGRDGNFILYNYAIFKAITERYIPKKIIVDISPGDLGYYGFEYERLSLLLPYYRTHPEIRSIVDLRGPFEKIKHISAIYPYNSLIFQIAIGNLEYNKKRVTENKGYLPLSEVINDKKADFEKIESYALDQNKIPALKNIISTCQQKNIELLFVYSPIFVIIRDTTFSNVISKLCSENSIRYVNMSNDPAFINKPEYFAQTDHLNDAGARAFSTILINEIWDAN